MSNDIRNGPGNNDCHDGVDALVLEMGGINRVVNPYDLLVPEFVEGLAEGIEQAGQILIRRWDPMLRWPAPAFQSLIFLLRIAKDRCVVAQGNGTRRPVTPFEASLSLAFEREDLRQAARWMDTLKLTASLLPDSAIPTAAQRIKEECRHRDLGAPRIDSLIREIRALNETATRTSGPSPNEEAEEYLAHVQEGVFAGDGDLQRHAQARPEAPPLRYFQDELFFRDGHRWCKKSERHVKAQLAGFLRPRVNPLHDTFIRSTLSVVKGLVLLPQWDQQMPFWVQGDVELQILHPRIVAFRNGMINLDEAFQGQGVTPILRPYDPRWFSEVSLPYDFLPGATCPLWVETLSDVLQPQCEGDNRFEILQEYMGWSLVAKDTQFERFLIMPGHGRNGKSTIVNVWEELLGRENVSHVGLDKLDHEFRPGAMAGKLANMVSDMNYAAKTAEGLLKQLVSGDPIQINRKNKEPINMRPSAKLVFACNDMPQLNDRSDGIWRRMIVLPFLQQIPELSVDTRRADRLKLEISGIFNWALQGAMRLYAQGGFSHCSVCQQALDEHRYNSDVCRQFFVECCEAGPCCCIEASLLYAAYRHYCQDNNRKARSSSEFGRQVVELNGVQRVRQSHQDHHGRRPWLYQGIALPPDTLQSTHSRLRRFP
jgi:P4 family phage/plasmid primase-like protien